MNPELDRELSTKNRSTIRDGIANDINGSYGALPAYLATCRFLPGSWDKRFVHDMARRGMNKLVFSPRQRASLLRLTHKYRKQLPVSVLIFAQDVAEIATITGKPTDVTPPC